MRALKTKSFWIAGGTLTLCFLVLLSIRLGVMDYLLSRPKTLALDAIGRVAERDSWMNIFQNQRKIGYSHTRLWREDVGYGLQESVLMHINTMGMVQEINLDTRARLQPDFTVSQIDFEINSGRFRFRVHAAVSGNSLTIRTESAGSRRRMNVKIKGPPYLLPGIIDAVAAAGLRTGDRYVFHIFDPATLGRVPLFVEVGDPEDIMVMGKKRTATRIALNFKGASQLAWIAKNGDLLQEKGLLGIRLEKTTRRDALSGAALMASRDLTRIVSVPSNVSLNHLGRLRRLVVQLNGIGSARLQLDGGRQRFKDGVLVIQKESLAGLPVAVNRERLNSLAKIFLKAGPFIQSDSPQIKTLARKIVGSQPAATPLEKVRRLADWIYQHIEKRPVLSLPDALSTLENRVGDCNEHAVLMAALSRAAGIPCRVEAGLTYLKGRFYYHAWNLVYLGRWITVDTLFDQLPADVGHLRLITGSPQQQMDLMGILGNIRLKIIAQK